MAYFSSGREAFDYEVKSFVEVAVATPAAAVAPAVSEAVAPLMRAFDGFEISSKLVEQQVQRLLERSH
jgi:hypothetical protein